MSLQTINPNANKTVKSFEEMTEKSVNAKVGKAQEAFTNWKETSYEERAASRAIPVFHPSPLIGYFHVLEGIKA